MVEEAKMALFVFIVGMISIAIGLINKHGRDN
jgi:hypothetical protein